MFPTISALKDLLRNLRSKLGDNLQFFIDLHGHSTKKNIFSYGPEYTMS
jgi:cytosolic carboxypeptidase protein 2/3